MSQITAIMIDSREPEYFQHLKFGGIPTMVTLLETGDVQAVTDDGSTLVFERKTPSDFLNSLKDDRLFPQIARMTEIRNAAQHLNEPLTYWPYLIITGQFLPGTNGKIFADGRETGWSFERLHGELLSIQEMGIFIVYANGDTDYENCILRVGRRNREKEMKVLASRPARMLGPQFDFLAGIQGVEIANSQKILDWCDGNLAQGFAGLVDLSLPAPIPMNVRKRFRTQVLRMQETEKWELVGTNGTEPVIGEKGKDYAS